MAAPSGPPVEVPPEPAEAAESEVQRLRGITTSVLYFSDDPIENLRLRILIRKQPSDGDSFDAPKTYKAALLRKRRQRESAGLDGGATDRSSAVEMSQAGSARRSVAVGRVAGGAGADPAPEEAESTARVASRTFDWQEKIFGPREILTLSQPQRQRRDDETPLAGQYSVQIQEFLRDRFPDTDVTESGRQWVMSQARGQQGIQLHTMVEQDGFIDPDETRRSVTTSESTELNPLAELVVFLPRRKKSKLATHLRYTSFYVLATVDVPTASEGLNTARKMARAGHQQVLCQARAYDNGIFELKPGFSEARADGKEGPYSDGDGVGFRGAEWYSFVTPAGAVYRYRIENAADDDSVPLGRAAGETLQREMALRRQQQGIFRNLSTGEFERSAQAGYFRLNAFGEISKTTGFTADNLYVEYELSTPEDWLWSPRDEARRNTACSHVSQALFLADEKDAYGPVSQRSLRRKTCLFGFPIEFELLGKEGQPPRPPTLYFQVSSVDAFERHRVVGNGFAQIPLTPGRHSLVVKTWRPIGTIRAQLRDFFLGSSSSLKDIKLSGIPPDFQGSFYNRYGLQTESAGDVHITLSLVITRHAPAGDPKEGDVWKATARRVRDVMRETRAAAAGTGAGAGSATSGASGLWKQATSRVVRNVVREAGS